MRKMTEIWGLLPVVFHTHDLTRVRELWDNYLATTLPVCSRRYCVPYDVTKYLERAKEHERLWFHRYAPINIGKVGVCKRN